MTRGFLVLLALLLAIGAAKAGNGIPSEEWRYDRLHEVERDTLGLASQQRAAAIEEKYGELFPERSVDEIRKLSDEALNFAFRAAFTVHFYARRRSHLETMSDYLSEMERRGIARNDARENFYRGLIGLREFNEAAAYLSRHADLEVEPVPELAVAEQPPNDAPSVYRTDANHRRLVREQVRVDRGVVVVAVVHPLCNPSRRAMETILGDRELLEAMKGSVQWITPQDIRLRFDALQAWNREHPDIPIRLTHDVREWPGIDDWSTPHFYLMRDGELQAGFRGWPEGEDNRGRLVELLERGGLL